MVNVGTSQGQRCRALLHQREVAASAGAVVLDVARIGDIGVLIDRECPVSKSALIISILEHRICPIAADEQVAYGQIVSTDIDCSEVGGVGI